MKKTDYPEEFKKFLKEADEETRLKLTYIGYLRTKEFFKQLLNTMSDSQKGENKKNERTTNKANRGN